MKRTPLIIIVALAALLGFAVAWWLQSGTDRASGSAAQTNAREILYWAAPMDPNYRGDKPGKSPMGMDLVPVYADQGGPTNDDQPSIRISAAVVNNIGVKTAPVARGTLYRNIETVGFIVPDDDLVAHIHVRTEGWIMLLEADTEGDRVQRGDLLFRVYSPALVSAQDEYLQALRIAQPALVRAVATRLRALGMSSDQIEALKSRREAQQLFDVRAPQDGYVIALNVRQGMFVQPNTTIMSLADLTSIWVDVDVFENQVGWLEVGQMARMQLPFAPGRVWHGQVEYIYPTIRLETRSARVRLAFDNPDLALKLEMYAAVEIDAAPRTNALHIPSQSVIRSGGNERVVLALGEGRFRTAQVQTGIESNGQVEIIDGLAEGESIVISSQFLFDSEASMDASLLRLIDAPTATEEQTDGQDSSSAQARGAVDPIDASAAKPEHDMNSMDQPIMAAPIVDPAHAGQQQQDAGDGS